jgi:imidazolonepropionase-like amidohydrolase
LEEPGLKYLPAFLTPERRRGLLWRMPQRPGQADADDRPPLEFSAEASDIEQRSRANQLQFLAMLHRAGGIIVPSTDTPFANMMPGFSLHLELAELVEAGISNSDVLQAATRVAAETLRRGDDLGTLEVGKIADVLVLDGDPLADINATRNVVTVIKEGVRYDPQELLDRVTTSPNGA